MERSKPLKSEFLVMQYQVVREEIIESMHNQMKILQLSILIIGGLFYGHILIFESNQAADFILDISIFGIIIPGVCFCFTLMLLSEISRMVLCGLFLKTIEDRIPHYRNVLYFEQWLSTVNRDEKSVILRSLKYLAEIFMFWCISILSLLYCYSSGGLRFEIYLGGFCFISNVVMSCSEMYRIRKLMK